MPDKKKDQLIQNILEIFKERDVLELTITDDVAVFKTYRKNGNNKS